MIGDQLEGAAFAILLRGTTARQAELRAQDSAILLAKLSQNRIDESESGNGDRLVQLLLFLDLNLLKNRAVFCHVFAEVCFPSINDFLHLGQFLFVGPDAAAFRTFSKMIPLVSP